jgi:aryl-alcohol dehydrogenase-like predicted oxidoreductase
METTLVSAVGMTSSRIGLGTWAMGGWMWGGGDDAEAIKTIRAALELGITLIDTAPAYGFGRAEELVGRAIAEHGGRERVLIATKAGLGWRGGSVYRDASAERIRVEIENSLHRLGTSYVDIYQVHWPDPLVPIEETAAAMAQLFERGTIRAIGVSNFSPEQMEIFRTVAPLHVVQSPYNLFERAIEYDVRPYAFSHDLTVFAYGALCRGLLSGRMRQDTKFTGTTCGRPIPSSSRAGTGSISTRSRGSTGLRASATTEACSPSPCAGSWTRGPPSPYGARAGPISCRRLAMCSTGTSMTGRGRPSMASLPKRSRTPSARNSWRRRRAVPTAVLILVDEPERVAIAYTVRSSPSSS